jgi:hypothetical protein
MTSHSEDEAAAEAAAVERWLDQLDPTTLHWHDGGPHRRIIAAVDRLEEAEEGVRRAVVEARAAGYSWAMIGAALGTTPDTARQRFAELEHEPSPAAAADASRPARAEPSTRARDDR